MTGYRHVMHPRLVVVLVALLALLAACSSTAPSASRATPGVVRCSNDTGRDTAALQQAVKVAERDAGTVVIAPGTCALDGRLVIDRPVTIEGQGGAQSASVPATLLVQHARANVFLVTAPDVTVEWLVLDTASYNATAPALKDPNPAVLFSNAARTTVEHVAGRAGSGFGMRLVGPNPCWHDINTGDIVSDVSMSTTGTGGFAAIDISCQDGARVSNITIHGGLLALFEDRGTTLSGETFTPGPRARTCAPPWAVTGPSSGVTITAVTSAGGHGTVNIASGPVTGLVVTGQTVTGVGCR